MTTDLALPVGKQVKKNDETYWRIRPAYRSYWRQLIALAIGAPFALAPGISLDLILALVGEGASAADELGDMTLLLVLGLRALGIGLLVWGALTILYGRFANRFYGSNEIIAKEYGIIAKSRNQVSLDHVRVVDIHQSWWDRIMNTGTLEFSTAGTAGVDVVWHGIPGPGQVQVAIQRGMREKSTDSED